MLEQIQRGVGKIVEILKLPLDEFTEERDSLFIHKSNHFIDDQQLDLLFDQLRIFGDSISVTLRQLSSIAIRGSFTPPEEKDFRDWVISAKNAPLDLVTVTIRKDILLQEKFDTFIRNDDVRKVLYFKESTVTSYINFLDLQDKLCIGSKRVVIFTPFWKISEIRNQYVSFVGSKYEGSELHFEGNVDDRYLTDRLTTQKLYSNIEFGVTGLLPDHLFFPDDESNSDIIKKMNIYMFLLAFHFIANISTRNEYTIKGAKNVRIKISNNLNYLNKDVLTQTFELYNSIYQNQTQDKLLICRNVMSIYLPSESNIQDLISLLPDIFSSVYSNFDSYVRDKIKSFFDKKKDLEKYVRDTSDTISKQISTISDNISKTWLGLAGALVAALITYITRGSVGVIICFFLLFAFLTVNTLNYSITIATRERELIKESFDHFIALIKDINDKEKAEIIGGVIESKLCLLDDVIRRVDRLKWEILFGVLIIDTLLFSYMFLFR